MGITGKMWAHEHWNLATPADIVTFGGGAGISGFFSTLHYRLDDLGLYFDQNTDLVKLKNFGLTWKYVQKKNLLSYVMDTSTFLKLELGRVEREKGHIANIRGYGTFLGFDAESETHADILQ